MEDNKVKLSGEIYKNEPPKIAPDQKQTSQDQASWVETLPQKETNLDQKPILEPTFNKQPQSEPVILSQPKMGLPQSSLLKIQNRLLPIVIGLGLVIIVVGPLIGFWLIKRDFFQKKGQSARNLTNQATETAAQKQSDQLSTKSEKLSGRLINWFVVTPPSTIPANQIANWKEYKENEFKINYPKEWEVKITNQEPVENANITKAIILGPSAANEKESPLSIVQIETDLTSDLLVEKIVKSQPVMKSSIAIAGKQAIKIEKVDKTNQEKRYLIPLTSKKYLELIYTSQFKEDDVIFEFILNSLVIT